MLRDATAIPTIPYAACHGGIGAFDCWELLVAKDGIPGLLYIHDDILLPGVSIGLHLHQHAEVYYIQEGMGLLLWDDEKIAVAAPHVSVIRAGHRHGLMNIGTQRIRLVVIGLREG